MQRIAESGLNVITVIHQPRNEIFQMFENLLLLGEGGRTLYLGKTKESIAYFEELGYKCPLNLNPADFLLDVATGLEKSNRHTVKHLPDIWEYKFQQILEKQATQKTVYSPIQLPSVNILSPLVQFFACLMRSVVQQWRDVKGLFVDSFLLFISGLTLGLIFLNKVYEGPLPSAISDLCPAALQDVCTLPVADPLINTSSMTVLGLSLIACMSSLRCFGKERIVFLRESQSGLSTISYFLAKDFSMIPMIAFSPLIFLSMYYGLLSPRAPCKFDFFYNNYSL